MSMSACTPFLLIRAIPQGESHKPLNLEEGIWHDLLTHTSVEPLMERIMNRMTEGATEIRVSPHGIVCRSAFSITLGPTIPSGVQGTATPRLCLTGGVRGGTLRHWKIKVFRHREDGFVSVGSCGRYAEAFPVAGEQPLASLSHRTPPEWQYRHMIQVYSQLRSSK